MTDRAYARISIDSATSGSIAKQRARLARFSAGEPAWYIDESVSGSKIPFNSRPAGRRLLRDLRPGDRVLVTKIDRAARNVRDLLGLVEMIEERGASICFVDQNIDTAGPMGRFLLTLLGAIAELEAGIISERRRESLEAFAAEGRHAVGKAPFGFRSVPNPNGRGLVIVLHAEESKLLRAAIERVLAGESQNQVRKSIGMSRTGFHKLLRNPRLAGMTPDGTSVVMIDDSPRVNPEAALLSMAEWRRLQDFLVARPAKTWSKADGHGPALRCGVCGERLYLNLSKRKAAHSTYRCRRMRGHRPDEPAASVIARNADAQIEADFLARFGALPVLRTVQVGSSLARDEAVALARVNLDAIRRAQDVATTESQEESLFNAYLRAKRDLREAEAILSEARFEEVPTGQTYAEAWAQADNATRTLYLQQMGPWIVEPGRMPIEQKVHITERHRLDR